MKRAISVIAAVSLAACGGGSAKLTADEARGALPGADQARIAAPASGAAHVAAGPRSTESTVGQVSSYWASTAFLSGAVNGSVAGALLVLRAVVESPPAGCSGPTCTWGPGSGALDPREWKLTVTKREGDKLEYDYALAGRLKASADPAFVTVLSGSAFPGGTPLRGSGQLTVFNDALQQLGGNDTGTLDVTYSNVAGVTVDATFRGFKDGTYPDQRLNAAYAYQESPTGGDLQVAFRNLTTLAQLALHSRWNLDGAGRGDASFQSGAIGVTASECWSAAATGFTVAYWTTNHPEIPALGPTSGSESACAFSPAAPPTLQAP